ncbi:MAG: hypothetical protein ACRDHI_13895 [Actinomycetota bacterium]
MATTKNGMGIARIVLLGLSVLLLTGVLGSFVMEVRARNSAVEDAVTQARAIADSSLTLVFKPEDTDAVASDSRADVLTEQIRTVVVDPSAFDTVTLWSPEAVILYATDEGRIGNRLDGEQERIRAALRDEPQTERGGGALSVMLPLTFDSGAGGSAAVELTTSDEPVAAAGAPWRTNAIFIGIALVVVVALLVWALRTPAELAGARLEQRLAPPVHSGGPAARPIAVQQRGMKEESDARRKAEDRARAAEDRLGVLQDQYRKTLDELQAAQNRLREASTRPDPAVEERAIQAEHQASMLEEHLLGADERARALEERSRELEERARLFERQAQGAKAELDELTRRLAQPPGDESGDIDTRLELAAQETIGVRAELEGAQTQLSVLRKEVEMLRPQADRARGLQAELDAVNSEVRRAQESSLTSQSELSARSKELEDLRAEVRALRTEEQRAAMLADELRSSEAELDSLSASHRAELIEREADLEQKARTMREEFQTEVARMEARHAEEMASKDLSVTQRIAGAEDAMQQRIDEVEREIAERTSRFGGAEDEIAKSQAEATRLGGELTVARAELETTVSQLTSESGALREATERLEHLEREVLETSARHDRLSSELYAASHDNVELNRRLQEVEARRQLELADSEGRADIDEILRVTQERLAGQTEKLIAAEERVHSLEREVAAASGRLEEAESELRQQAMAHAMRQIRGDGDEIAGTREDEAVSATSAALEDAAAIEDRRATSPFVKELAVDARKSLTRILGITQILKHKKDGKEHAQLVRQLATYTRRLDHVVADLADAERLVRGTVELTVRRTDLEPLVQRVAEESGVDADHDLRVETERVVVAVDQQRTEQIVAGLLRSAGDRTPPKKTITVRLSASEGGALIAVEDPEPSSDASLSPVVRRFAEVQGGRATVESGKDGGSAFKVFLPNGAGVEARAGRGAAADEVAPDDGALHIVVDGVQGSASANGSMLVDELHRLSTAED